LKFWRLSLFLLFLFAAPAHAQTAAPVETGIVREVLKADMILLENSKRYRLDGIRVPADYTAPAMERLVPALTGKNVKIYGALDSEKEIQVDRYGVPLAQIVREEDGRWIQADLVENGLAWASLPAADSKKFEMLRTIEQEARDARQGFWAHPDYGIKTPENIGDYMNSYQIVEGKVLFATLKKSMAFINFGRDWKTDFTLELSDRGLWSFVGANQSADMSDWRGKRVRVRGWVEDKNGPMIRLEDPLQIEFLQDNPPIEQPKKKP